MADTTDQATSRAGMQALFTYMTALVDRKRSQPSMDVISDLIQAQHDEGFPEERIAGAASGLLFAGHITTVNAIDRGVLLLCAHPDQRAVLAANPHLVFQAVEEILRAPSPLPNSSPAVPANSCCSIPEPPTATARYSPTRNTSTSPARTIHI
jgi:cytochrome P450